MSDLEAIPLLRKMFDDEPREGGRLIIAGALWKLNQDPLFIECLNQAKRSGLLENYFHVGQVLWLNDERAIDFLIDLLPETNLGVEHAQGFRGWEHAQRLRRLNRFLVRTPFRRLTEALLRHHLKAQGASPWALGLLNHLETAHIVPRDEKRPPSYYRERRNDPAFCAMMLEAVHKSIVRVHHGR